MKRGRWLALLFLVAALIAILITGFYLGITHKEARPADSTSPGTTAPLH
ncbi:hypothetical protein ACPPVV_06260 [Rhodanobacter sp. Col0626]